MRPFTLGLLLVALAAVDAITSDRLKRFCNNQHFSVLLDDFCYVPFYTKRPISFDEWEHEDNRLDFFDEFCAPVVKRTRGLTSYYANINPEKHANLVDDLILVDHEKRTIDGVICAFAFEEECDHLPPPLVNMDNEDEMPDVLKDICFGYDFVIHGDSCYSVEFPPSRIFRWSNNERQRRRDVLAATCQRLDLRKQGILADYAYVDHNIKFRLREKGLLDEHNYYWVKKTDEGEDQIVLGKKEFYPAVICQFWVDQKCRGGRCRGKDRDHDTHYPKGHGHRDYRDQRYGEHWGNRGGWWNEDHDCYYRHCDHRHYRNRTRTTTTAPTTTTTVMTTTTTTLPPTTTESTWARNERWAHQYVYMNTVKLMRAHHNGLVKKHVYHYDINYISWFYPYAYYRQADMGYVLPMKTYLQNQWYIDTACPNLVTMDDCVDKRPLLYMHYNQYFRKSGDCEAGLWGESRGPMMKVAMQKGYCGANRPVYYIESAVLIDSFYTSHEYEYQTKRNDNPFYDSPRGIAFWIW
ncbi:hypothetical protein L596_030315 [Steinernema carpocapsae]|uniref:Uncharacterized protein n=1 Tax=Steinernema carpocapsae TaxID=34508 RepID=A0A4U5LP21_STECR|nr:hypothetical protein L596_030315 [Steinernema carpocapsae]